MSCQWFSDLPPPPEPPPCQGLRIQGPRSVGNVGSPGERKASSLERQHMGGRDEVKSSLERQARTSLERRRHGQERLGSMERAEEARRAQKNGPTSGTDRYRALYCTFYYLEQYFIGTNSCDYLHYGSYKWMDGWIFGERESRMDEQIEGG